MHLESIDSAWHLPHLVMFTSQYFIHDINHEKKKSVAFVISLCFFLCHTVREEISGNYARIAFCS